MEPLVAALQDPACYPHPVAGVQLIETHISWVLLAGDYAYKIKKPVRFAFLDFSTLEARRRYCEEELRLNRRTAASYYLDVVGITQGDAGVRIAAAGQPVEYAVRMRRFPPGALAEDAARRGALDAAGIDAIAAAVAAFHAETPRAGSGDAWGEPRDIAAQALANFDDIAALAPSPGGADAARLAFLRDWTRRACAELAPAFDARRAGGFVRECHGDLHLGNIAFVDGGAMPFDCIEFDPGLRWIDVVSEIAFLFMDLLAHRLHALAWRLLNAWLQESGDYAGVRLLRFYAVYRAMVRAKVARLSGALDAASGYIALADALARVEPHGLVLMHGVSGAGKTVASQALLEHLGAVRLRSDVERKRLAGLAAQARAAAPPGAGIYDDRSTERTYERLAVLAAGILESGWPAVVDAAFLQRAQRDALRGVAQRLRLPCAIAACEAPEADLRRRIAAREAAAQDASDAGIAVLERQLADREPLGEDEQRMAVRIDTQDGNALRQGLEEIALRLAQPGG
ncbi:MAG: AAA family ATPase [Burkholderiales bacterium]